MPGQATTTEAAALETVAILQRHATRALEAADAGDWQGALYHAALAEHGASHALEDAASVARERGASWSHIGEQIGTSKQAAQQRFGPKIA